MQNQKNKQTNDKLWENGFEHAVSYYNANGNLLVSSLYVCADGYTLGRWVAYQKRKFNEGTLSEERKERLDTINMNWGSRFDHIWLVNYERVKKYYDENGTIYPLTELPVTEECNLYKWVHSQIYHYNSKKHGLLDWQIKLLEEVGISWDLRNEQWENMYTQAKQYFSKFCKDGRLIISNDEKYRKLKTWISNQRKNYKRFIHDNEPNPLFTDNKIKKLEEIGMVWDEYEAAWEDNYALAKEFFETYNSLDVTLVTGGKHLFGFIHKQRVDYKKGKLSANQIYRLEQIGMIWDASSKLIKTSFPERAIYFYLSKVYEDIETSNRELLGGRELDIYIPSEKVAIEYDGVYYHMDKYDDDIKKCEMCIENGLTLYRVREDGLPDINMDACIIIHRRGQTIEALNDALIKLFAELGLEMLDINIARDLHDISDLVTKSDDIFEYMFSELEDYYKDHGNARVPYGYKTKNGHDLYKWITTQRMIYKGKAQGSLTNRNIKRLEAIGMEWDIYRTNWEEYYSIAKKYYEEKNDLLVPRHCIIDGKQIGSWIHAQRGKYKDGKLSENRIRQLEDIGMVWDASFINESFEYMFSEAKRFYEENSHLNVPQKYRTSNGEGLNKWIVRQRAAYFSKKLSMDKIKRLESIGMKWDGFESKWNDMFMKAKSYYEANGNLQMPKIYKMDGKDVKGWLNRQKKKYKNGILEQEKIDLLNSIGIVW